MKHGSTRTEDVLEARNAVKFSQYCWYNVTTHFALRSAEVQVQLKKSQLSFETDGEGQDIDTSKTFLGEKQCRSQHCRQCRRRRAVGKACVQRR